MQKKRFRQFNKDLFYDEVSSPVGQLTIVASQKGLQAVLWDVDREQAECDDRIKALTHLKNEHIILQTKNQLAEYFEGKRKLFDLPLNLVGTAFQIKAWNELLKIPYATTISYAKQAERMGDKNKARAVGTANGYNPLSIIVPCHRVIGSNGQLAGFAGGVDKKIFLIELEKKIKENEKFC